MADPSTWRRRPHAATVREIWQLRFPVAPTPALAIVAALYQQYQLLTYAEKGESAHACSPQAERLAMKIHAASTIVRTAQRLAWELEQ